MHDVVPTVIYYVSGLVSTDKTKRIGKQCRSTNSGLESVLENLVTVAGKKEVVILSSASTWVTIISLALRLSRVKALARALARP